MALIVLWPLLKNGFILTLDMVFTPQLRMPVTTSNDYLLRVLLHGLSLFIASSFLEKIILFAILLLSGVGANRLARITLESERLPHQYQEVGCYFAGFLYVLNPFTYDRFMAGQYEVLLGYALLPWFARSLLAFVDSPSTKQIIKVTAWAVIVSVVSIHSLGLLAIISIVMLGLKTWSNRSNREWRRKIITLGLAAIAAFLIVSSYWVVPTIEGSSGIATQIASFTIKDREAFAIVGSNPLEKTGNILRLQGFWLESRGLYILPQNYLHIWRLLGLLVWIIVLIGGVSLWRTKQRVIVWFSSIVILSAVLLALGLFNNWLATYIPFFAGYREPEKFVALIALIYAMLASKGVTTILTYCYKTGKRFFLMPASIVMLSLPIVWSSIMLGGFRGQLTAVEYPKDWYTMNNFLNQDKSSFAVLFVPWHLYMGYAFAGRIIASPAPKFFDKPIISSNDPEFNGAAPLPNATDAAVGSAIAAALNKNTDISTTLARYRVKYILLARDDDFRLYENYLQHQPHFHLIKQGATINLYNNDAF